MTEIVVGLVLAVLGLVLAATVSRSAGGLTALAGGTVALVGQGALPRVVDEPVLEQMLRVRTPGWTGVAEALSLYGGTLFTGGLAVVVGAVLAWRGHTAAGLVWVGAVALGATTIRGLKVVLDRPRPPELARLAQEATESLPSGHALMAALGLGLGAAGAVRLARGRCRGLVVGSAASLAVLLAAGIGASRVYLGVHWVSDVLAGWLLGAALAALAVTVARTASRRTAERALHGR